MKKWIFALPVVLAGCGEIELPEVPAMDDPADVEQVTEEYTKKFCFTVKGDFGNAAFVGGGDAVAPVDTEQDGLRVGVVYEPTSEWGDSNRMTRANQYMTADGVELAEMWVVDYKDGAIQQSLHQTASDADWGAPTMSLTLGTHHVLFLASRGTGAAYQDGVVTWSRMNDTFYTDYEVTVAKTSNGNRAVTLNRVATKFALVIEDAIPSGTTSVTFAPETWYSGWNMLTGEAVAADGYVARYDLPSSWWGGMGSTLNMWGLSGADEWQTDVAIESRAGETVNASAVIAGAPMKANRVTRYSGKLFSNDAASSVSLATEWLTAYEGVY